MSENMNLWKKEVWATLVLSIPLIISNLANVLINATDVFLLGRLGKDALAAAAIGTSMVLAPMVFGIGIIVASSAMIARELGRRKFSVREVRRTVRASFHVSILFSIPVMIILWFTGDFLRLVGLEAKLAHNVGIFVRALEFQILPVMLIVSLRNFVIALGKPMWSMIIGFVNVGFNAFLNSGLILGYWGIPQMGLIGAGIGSSFTALFSFCLFAIVVSKCRPFKFYRIFGRFWRPDMARLKELWGLGYPIGMQIGFEVSVFAVAVVLMGLIGTAAAAAHSVAIQLASLTFNVPMGIAQAATVRVGTALGRGDEDGIKRAGWAAFVLGVGFMVFTALLFWFFPAQLAGIFLDEKLADSAQVLALAILFLKVGALFQVFDGAQAVCAGMLRGLHDTKAAMVFAFIGYWIVGLGVGGFFAFYTSMGAVGIWIGLASGLAIDSVLMLIRWVNRRRYGLLP